MSGLPAEMTDRWQDRAEPAPGEGLIYWHMLVGLDPDVLALATDVRRRLARFPGLHMTPLAWLHMTVLIAGARQGDQRRPDPGDGCGRLASAGQCPADQGDRRKDSLPTRRRSH